MMHKNIDIDIKQILPILMWLIYQKYIDIWYNFVMVFIFYIYRFWQFPTPTIKPLMAHGENQIKKKLNYFTIFQKFSSFASTTVLLLKKLKTRLPQPNHFILPLNLFLQAQSNILLIPFHLKIIQHRSHYCWSRSLTLKNYINSLISPNLIYIYLYVYIFIFSYFSIQWKI